MSMQLTDGHRAAFFPKADAAVLTSRHSAPLLADRPTTTAPILDPEHADQPLETWTPEQMKSVYPSRDDLCAPAPIPTKSQCPRQCHADYYLFPVLTRNERLRLTMLFYYTRGALEDDELMSRLQEKVLLAHETVGWEFVIAGLLNHNTYTRLVTVNLPLAVLPRRESTCAHTINQTPGAIFALHNMANDWRFERSPHVEIGGLRAYAGVPLRFQTEFGEHVAFGSLCVASNSPEELLSQATQQALVRLADWIVADIVHSARARRQRERRRMLELLSRAQRQCDERVDMEQEISNILREVYPGTEVSIVRTMDGLVVLENGATFSTSDLEQGLWEDTDHFEYSIKNLNHLDLTADRAVRAVVAQCTSQTVPTFLVVACKDFKLVFDDIDSWFAQMCATVLCRYWQGKALQEALTAKESFLRGITHQLRTPIHGILGSAELLTEELKIRNVVPPTAASSPSGSPEAEQLDPYTYIRTIKTSARELISTVNSLIKLNQWADIAQAERILELRKVSSIESHLLSEVLNGLSDDLSIRPSIIILDRLPCNCDTIVVDMRVFLDCIQPLVAYAAQFSSGGVVAVTLTIAEDYGSLIVDVYHNGCDVVKNHCEANMDARKHIDLSSTESALGLTLACKAAALLNGQVALMSPKQDPDLHIRATFSNPVCACSISPPRMIKDRLVQLPEQFYHLTSASSTSSIGQHFSRWLSDAGWSESEDSNGTFVVVDYTPNLAQLYKQLESADAHQVAICLVPENASFLDFHKERVKRQGKVVFAQGPFLTEHLEQAMVHADVIQAELGSSHSDAGSRPFGGVAINPPLPPATQRGTTRPAKIVERGSVFPEKARTELAESLQSLRIQAKALAPPAQSENDSSKPMTLLVDDNNVNLRLLEMYCTRRGIPYRTAKDGQQAVEIFSDALETKYDPLLRQELPSQPFDLILMDLQMPVCDGIDATRQIRKIEKERGRKKSVLFIVTGQDSTKDRKNAEDAGADEFLTKPVGPKVLDQWVKKWCPEAEI